MHPPVTPSISSSRLRLATGMIDTARLEHETNRLFGFGLVVALLVQTALFVLVNPERLVERIGPRPIPVSLIITPPRLRRPFVVHSPNLAPVNPLKKGFEPATPGPLVNERPAAGKLSIGDTPLIDLGELTIDNIDELLAFSDSLGIGLIEVPDVIAEYVRRRRSDEMFLMENLLSIDDLASVEDRYQGLVIYNPTDPMSITGIVSLPNIYDYRQRIISNGVTGLAETINTLTDIHAYNGRPVTYNSAAADRTPMIYIGISDAFRYSDTDITWFRNYIESGGFVVLENQLYVTQITPAETSLKQFMKDMFGSRLRFEPLSDDHAIYHCYFHFDESPMEAPYYNESTGMSQLPVHYIEGIYMGNRMIGVYSNKGWGRTWGTTGGTGPFHRMGVNMLVYALRNGGTAERYVDTTLSRGPNGDYASYFHEFTAYGAEQQGW